MVMLSLGFGVYLYIPVIAQTGGFHAWAISLVSPYLIALQIVLQGESQILQTHLYQLMHVETMLVAEEKE